jgi:hypothetical protein
MFNRAIQWQQAARFEGLPQEPSSAFLTEKGEPRIRMRRDQSPIAARFDGKFARSLHQTQMAG